MCYGAVAAHMGIAHKASAFRDSEGAMAPRSYDRLGAADSGGCSSAITPLWH